jgi:hypothetical protein
MMRRTGARMAGTACQHSGVVKVPPGNVCHAMGGEQRRLRNRGEFICPRRSCRSAAAASADTEPCEPGARGAPRARLRPQKKPSGEETVGEWRQREVS